ncbi:hypothetical protein P3X46_013413 [Hevea brasiliensis]|uniref:Reverse transcriptase domain-containing protein n=1 Tax=Hevea brasiliensis TaxID=3981 RepID=A0ABQ9M585_HEVBR|nr:hypothetical protein P3X46_013413 [Hevea brasiliensis]
MECVTTVSYSIQLNGHRIGLIKPSRGLRQATLAEARKIRYTLQVYLEACGQEVNLTKLALFFSPNTPYHIRNQISSLMGIPNVGGQDKFLGLPIVISRSKTQAFEAIKSKIQSRAVGWKEKLLSQGGKEMLIKAIATAIPVFAMTSFRLPSTLCKAIDSMIAKFWWGQKEEERDSLDFMGFYV